MSVPLSRPEDRPEGATQTIFAGREDGALGNCLQAAVATLFGKPLDCVPHFVAFQAWEEALILWLNGIEWHRESTSAIPAERCIVFGPSPRGVDHVCVAEGGRIVWDPHPSRDGLTEVREVWRFIDLERAL